MLLSLLKVRFLSLFAAMLTGKQKRRSLGMIILLSLLLLWAAASFLALFGGMLILIAEPLFRAGASHVYFGIGGLFALLLMLVGSGMLTKNQLYVAGDNELLLSMPIPARFILLSRLLFLLVINYFLEALLAIPLVGIWLLSGRAEAGTAFCLLAVLLALPLLALSLSSFFAYLISRISAKIPKKSLVTVLFSLLFIGAYYFFVFGLEGFLTALAEDVTPLVVFVDSFAPAAILGRAMDGAVPELLLVLFTVALTVLLVLYWLSRTYLRTVLEPQATSAPVYRARRLRRRTPLYALTVRELRHLGSSAGYMLNAGIGLLFMVAVPILLLFRGEMLLTLYKAYPFLKGTLPAIGTTVMMMLSSMVFFSASAVSLEGRALWIVRTSPVPTYTVLLSKLLLHLIPTLPAAAIGAILTSVALRLDVRHGLLLLLNTAAFVLLSALFGLVANLFFPRLTWKNELEPIKQGMASLVAMLGSGLAALLFGGGSILLSILLPASLALLILLALTLAAAFGLLAFLRRGGVRIFESL
ncbi:MAG: hypothetical protein J6T24_07870 [Clostridia bacterium]|nr:hypothetical protein [Clostridia bacterium]